MRPVDDRTNEQKKIRSSVRALTCVACMTCLIKCNQFIFHPLPAPGDLSISPEWLVDGSKHSHRGRIERVQFIILFSSKQIVYFVLVFLVSRFRSDTLSLLLCQVFGIIFSQKIKICFGVSLRRHGLYHANNKKPRTSERFWHCTYLYLPFAKNEMTN